MNIIGSIKKYKYYFIAAAIIIVLFRGWFLSLANLSTDDWYYKFNETMQTFRFWPSLWSTQPFGTVNLLLSTHSLNFLWGSLSHLLPFNITERLLFLFPALILSFVGSFKLANSVLKNQKLAVIASIIYSMNSYVWVTLVSGHLNIYVAYSLMPLFLLFFIKHIETNQVKYFLLSLLLAVVTSIYDFRFIYIIFIILGSTAIYYLAYKEKLQFYNALYATGFIGLIIILFHLYWIIPLYTQNLLTENEILSRNIFGSQFFDITHSMTLSHPYWNGWEIEHFIKHPILILNFLLPILLVIGLIKTKNRKIYFFGILAILGIFLTKQASEPFSLVYTWLFNHIPGFNAFREASKFSALLYLGYSILIANSFGWISKTIAEKIKVSKTHVLTGAMIMVLLFSSYPILFGSIKPMFRPNKIHNDYLLLKEFLEKDQEAYRTLWIPKHSRWHYYDNEKGAVSFGEFITQMELVELNALNIAPDKETDLFKYYAETNYLSYLLSKANIKYVGVPVYDKNDDFFELYEISREEAIALLDKNPGLEKQNIGSNELVIYKVKNYIGESLITTSDKLITIEKGEFANTYSQIKAFENNKVNFTYQQLDFANKLNPLFYSTSDLKYSHELNTEKVNEVSLNRAIFQVTYTKTGNNVTFNFINPNLLRDAADNLIFQQTDLFARQFSLELKPETIYKVNVNGYEHLISDGSFIIFQGEVSEFVLNEYSSDKTVKKEVYKLDLAFLKPEQNIILKKNVNTPTLNIPSTINDMNILRNGDFEKGTWQPEVGDCNKFDDDPKIAMNLIIEESDSYLSLESTRHNACSGLEFQVKGGSTYKFSFDYKTPNASQIGYYIQFDDKKQSSASMKVNVTKFNEWNSYSEVIQVPYGVKNGLLVIYSYATDLQTNIISQYDNFEFREVMNLKNLYSIYTKTDSVLGKPEGIKFQNVEPGRKEVAIYAAKEKFILKLGELYSSGWDIYSNGKAIKTDNFKIDGKFNGWIINPAEICKQIKCREQDGKYSFDLELYFTPQKTLNLGIILAIIFIPLELAAYFIGKDRFSKYLYYEKQDEMTLVDNSYAQHITLAYFLLFWGAILLMIISGITYISNPILANKFGVAFFFVFTTLLVMGITLRRKEIKIPEA